LLKWIVGSKADHPLADARQARSLLSELPANDSVKALEEITAWLESLAEAERIKPERLFEIVELLDTSAKSHQRKLVYDYLAMARQQKVQENRLWMCGHRFARALGDAYMLCVTRFRSGAGSASVRKHMPVIAARALRALAFQMKWIMLRYGPFEPKLWSAVGELYRYSEQQGFSDIAVTVYPGAGGASSPKHEYLKILMLWASSADVLAPLQQEIAERAVAQFAPAFRLSKTPAPDLVYYFDPTGDKPPARRLRSTPPTGELHYFGPGDAHARVAQFVAALEKSDTVPPELSLGRAYPADTVLAVLRHLRLYWSEKPPERVSERTASTARITIVPGYLRLLDELERNEEDALNFSVSSAESWIVENASDNGFGALVPAATSDWVHVGELIGVQVGALSAGRSAPYAGWCATSSASTTSASRSLRRT
jgi:hypothetical protein